MDNNTLINQLTNEVDNLVRIYVHVTDGSPGMSQLPDYYAKQLETTIQRLDKQVQTLSRQSSLNQARDLRPELDKTYTVTHSDEGWRLRFQPNIAPHFGMEPSRSLREVIERVENLHPEYRPRLTSSQLEDYARELNDLVDIHGYEAFVPHAVSALMRCAPTDMPPSKRIALQEDAKSAFETGVGLPHVIRQLGPEQQQKPQFSKAHRKELKL